MKREMEIKDHLALIRRRLWLVVLIPLLAAGATAGLVLRQPQEYLATATVAVPGLVGGQDGQFSGSTGNRAFVANFLAVVHSRAIAEAVSVDTNVPVDAIFAGTVTSPVGESSLVTVTFRTDTKANADPVVTALATKSLAFMFDPRLAVAAVTQAQTAVDGAKQAVADAQAGINAFVAETKLANPSQDYQVKAQQISTLEEQAVAASSRGDGEASARIAAAAVAMKPQLTSLGGLVARFNILTETKQRALSQLDESQRTLAAATAKPAAVDPVSAVSVSATTAAARLQSAVQKAVAAFAAAFFLVLLALFTMEAIFRGPSEPESVTEVTTMPATVRI
jgi:capsular polysaccharide biosynthesis protein